MTAPLAVFGFGSLMYEPEHPEALIDAIPAWWPGWRRAFNKRSHARGCDESERRWPDLPVRPDFRTGTRVLSLALGTEPDPARTLEARVLRYRPEAADDVLAALDAREGYDAEDPHSGYLRDRVTVRTAAGTLEAVVYRTNPHSALYVGDLPPAEAAAILLAATPSTGRRARGVDYLVQAVATLAEIGLHDPDLDVLLATARAHGSF